MGYSASQLAETIKKLEHFQNLYLRFIYSCPPSTPLPALRSQAGMLGVSQRIWLEKINLVAVILHRTEEDNYSRQVLEEQVLMNWEGLAKEAKELCKLLGLPDVTKKYIPREDIKSAVIYHNVKTVKEEMAPLRKLSMIKYSDCRVDCFSSRSCETKITVRYRGLPLELPLT